jgi:hypothetical protein
MKLGVAFREQMGGVLGPVQHEFDHMNGILNTWRKKEHNADGTHGDLTATSLDNDGLTRFGGPWEIPRANVLRAAQITGTVNNYAPPGIDTAIVLQITTDAARNMTGLQQYDPNVFRWLLLMNVAGNDLVIKHNDAGSLATNRIACPGSVDFTLNAPNPASVWMFYDAGAGNWRLIGVA